MDLPSSIHSPGVLPDAQHRLYSEHVTWVWKTLQRLGSRSADVEDLAHEVFMAAFRALPSFDAARPIRPWLFGIAFRVLSDHRRLKRHVLEVPSGDDVPEAVAEHDPDADIADRQARALLLRALGTLEPERRAVFVMHEIDEMPVPQIAEALDVGVNTTYSRLRLARADVGRAIEQLRSTGSAA